MSRKIFTRGILLLLATVFLGLATAFIFFYGPDFNRNDPSKPRINLPFDLKKVGETYSFDVNLRGPLTCSLDVKFFIAAPNKWSRLLDKNRGIEEERRFYDLLGGSKLINHEWIEPGVPAKFRVQFIQKEGNKVILDKIVDHPKTGESYMGRYTILAQDTLQAGTYTIRLDYLEGAPELAPLYAEIRFSRAYTGK